ncbi:gas vesicle protein K [Geodermatophilus sp. SYSU D00703]
MTAGDAGRRLAGSGEDVGRGLGRLVVTLLEVVRQVVERQALRRVEVGDLSDEEIERLGRALMDLERTFDELIDHFGVVPNDLYLPIDLNALVRSDRVATDGVLPLTTAPSRRDP